MVTYRHLAVDDRYVPYALSVLSVPQRLVRIVPVADVDVVLGVYGDGRVRPHIPVAVDHPQVPRTASIGGVVQVPVGIIVVADVDIVLRVDRDRGIVAHVTLAVDDPLGPRAARIGDPYKVPIGVIIVADVDVSHGIDGYRAPLANVPHGVDRQDRWVPRIRRLCRSRYGHNNGRTCRDGHYKCQKQDSTFSIMPHFFPLPYDPV